MNQPKSIIITSLFFLFGLLIFRAIIPSLEMTFAALVIFITFEIIWNYRQSKLFLTVFNPLVNFIVSAGFTLSLYIIIYFPIEFFLTEIVVKIPRIPYWVGTLILILFAIASTFIDWRKKIVKKSAWITVFLFFIVCGLMYFLYHNEKLSREYLPKIYAVDPRWAIQGQFVKIKGLNLGHTFRPGKVLEGDEEMNIIYWSNELIISEQPVPSFFRKERIKIVRYDGISSNKLSIEIRNPDFLLKGKSK